MTKIQMQQWLAHESQPHPPAPPGWAVPVTRFYAEQEADRWNKPVFWYRVKKLEKLKNGREVFVPSFYGPFHSEQECYACHRLIGETVGHDPRDARAVVQLAPFGGEKIISPMG